jgi:predicted nucleotidyltransferase
MNTGRDAIEKEEKMNEKIKHFVEEVKENFDLLLFPFYSLYTFGMFFGDFGGFSKSSKEYLIDIYGERIKQVMVYGSYARGKATEESDIDVLIVVDDSLNSFEVRKSLSDILFDILLENGELISVIAIPESYFKNYNSPFLLNVKEEGVTV